MELVAGIGRKQSPNHMLSPTKPQLRVDLDLMIAERNKQKRQGKFLILPLYACPMALSSTSNLRDPSKL
jgi:hypothetical protein